MEDNEEDEEEEIDEDEEFKENRPPSSLATQSEIEGTVTNDLEDALFDTEEEAEDEGERRQIFWKNKNICRSSK